MKNGVRQTTSTKEGKVTASTRKAAENNPICKSINGFTDNFLAQCCKEDNPYLNAEIVSSSHRFSDSSTVPSTLSTVLGCHTPDEQEKLLQNNILPSSSLHIDSKVEGGDQIARTVEILTGLAILLVLDVHGVTHYSVLEAGSVLIFVGSAGHEIMHQICTHAEVSCCRKITTFRSKKVAGGGANGEAKVKQSDSSFFHADTGGTGYKFPEIDMMVKEVIEKAESLVDEEVSTDAKPILPNCEWLNKMCVKCKAIHATFGKPGETASSCGTCKEEGMVDVVHKMCVKCGKTQPSFGKPGETASSCGTCKEEGMVDVRHKMCVKCGKTRATFGKPGETATFCGTCKGKLMVDVRNKMCEGMFGKACPDQKRASKRMRYDRAKRASEGG